MLKHLESLEVVKEMTSRVPMQWWGLKRHCIIEIQQKLMDRLVNISDQGDCTFLLNSAILGNLGKERSMKDT